MMPTPVARKPVTSERAVPTAEWPSAIADKVEVTLDVHDDQLERQRNELKERALQHRAEANPNPNEQHRGQTAQEGSGHDRHGSQPERVKHQYPNGNRPNSGGARSSNAKGQRRDNMSQGGE